jgi:hypothetical protein
MPAVAHSLPNPGLKDLDDDFMYHIGYSRTEDLKAMFGDVRVVVTGGSTSRLEKVAQMIQEHCNIEIPFGSTLTNISRSDRYQLVMSCFHVFHHLSNNALPCLTLLSFAVMECGRLALSSVSTMAWVVRPVASCCTRFASF